MRRGSTYTNTFSVNVDLRGATVYVTYRQGDVVVEKTGRDLAVSENAVVVNLTQAETLSFDDGRDVKIQIRYVTADGSADASNIMKVRVEEILKDGEIEYVSG